MRGALLAALFWTAALGGGVLLAHRRYLARDLREFPPRQRPQNRPEGTDWISDEELRALGWVEPRMPRGGGLACGPRPKGTVRIGCFGDSFTYGDEVKDGADFPAQLQAVLRREGVRARVLNFGVRGYSFAQSLLMWEAVRKRGCVDAAVFGPSLWAADRDLSLGDRAVHARFALSREGLSLVVPPGANQLDQRRQALKLLPPAPYWRYDRRAPTPLAMWAPEGRTLRNPFYYFRGSPEEEQKRLYALLLRRVADSGMPALVFGPDREWLALAPRDGSLWSALTRQPLGAANLRPRGHQSPLGNLAVAEQVACALRGRARCRVDALRVEPSRVAAGTPGKGALPVFFARQKRQGRTVDAEPGTPQGPLLALAAKRWSWLDGYFLPLDPPPAPGSPVLARWLSGGKEGEAALGAVVPMAPELASAVIDWELLHVWRQGMRLSPDVPTGDMLGLWVGDRQVLRPCGPDGLLCPVAPEYFRAYLEDPPAGRAGSIVLNGAAVGRWTRTSEPVDLALDGPPGSVLARLR